MVAHFASSSPSNQRTLKHMAVFTGGFAGLAATVPAGRASAAFSGTASLVSASSGQRYTVTVRIAVGGPAVPNGGDDDKWRGTRSGLATPNPRNCVWGKGLLHRLKQCPLTGTVPCVLRVVVVVVGSAFRLQWLDSKLGLAGSELPPPFRPPVVDGAEVQLLAKRVAVGKDG